MSKIQQSVIFSGESCGEPEALDVKDPSLNADVLPLNVFAKDDSILSEQVVEKVTCDDNIVFGSFEDDFDGFTFGSCDVCKNVCVPTLSMSGGVKMCGQKQMVSLNASFDEKYTGPECFIKVRLETEGDSSSGYPADTLYTYLRAIPGERYFLD